MRGSVRAKALKRGGQQWYAIYDLPALDGRRRQKWEKATPNTRKAAEALLDGLLAKEAG